MVNKSLFPLYVDLDFVSRLPEIKWTPVLYPFIMEDSEMKLQSSKVEVVLEEKPVSLEDVFAATENQPVDEYAWLKEFGIEEEFEYAKAIWSKLEGNFKIRVNQDFINKKSFRAYEIYENDKLKMSAEQLVFSPKTQVKMKCSNTGCSATLAELAVNKRSVWIEVSGPIAYTY